MEQIISMFPIELYDVKTNPAKSARNLWVIFDKHFTFRSHLSAVCSSWFYHMRDLRHIRHHLDLDSAKLHATALVSSHLDYCNSLLYGIADTDLTRLHSVYRINCPTWWQSPPYTCSLPLLRSLHWLPVRFRLLFKINLLTYKTLREKQPVYLRPMFATSIQSRLLRSNDDNSLSVVRVKTNTGARAFHSCLFGTTCWCLSKFLHSHFSCYLQETSEDTSLWLNFSLIDTGTSNGLLMLRNCFFDFAIEHWFDCRTTEPGFARDIGAIEFSLIDWLIDIFRCLERCTIDSVFVPCILECGVIRKVSQSIQVKNFFFLLFFTQLHLKSTNWQQLEWTLDDRPVNSGIPKLYSTNRNWEKQPPVIVPEIQHCRSG